MNEERNSSDHNQHQSRDGIKEETEADNKIFSESKPCLIEDDGLDSFTGFGYEIRAEEIG